MHNKDLTIIICATNLNDAQTVCDNVESTSGLKCESIIYDNKNKESISLVYNKCIKLVLTPYVLFAHQDIKIVCQNHFKWGQYIINQLKMPNTGVIGFAGSKCRFFPDFGGWAYKRSVFNSMNVIQLTSRNLSESFHKRILCKTNSKFDPVVTVDGLGMFVRTELARKFLFDEQFITDFHCYDIDFCLTLFNNKYINYVTTLDLFSIVHYSVGKYTKQWAETTIKLANFKWNLTDAMTTCSNLLSSNMISELEAKKDNCLSKFGVKPICTDYVSIYICNFNTTKLTNNLILSIRKHIKSFKYRIFVLDNSDSIKFTTTILDITVLDNTKQQLIDFDKLSKTFSKYEIKHTRNGSFKHTYSIQYLMNICNTRDMLLFDSDTIVLNDIDIIDPSYVTCSQVLLHNALDDQYIISHKYAGYSRFTPYLQYFNIELIRKHHIDYFNPSYIIGGLELKLYDTGAYFYDLVINKKLPYKNISFNKYIIHFMAGSHAPDPNNSELTGIKHKI